MPSVRPIKKRTNEPPVKVRASFVDVKNDNTPSVYIEDPIEFFGDIYADEFDILKKGIEMIVKDPNYNLFIHNDECTIW